MYENRLNDEKQLSRRARTRVLIIPVLSILFAVSVSAVAPVRPQKNLKLLTQLIILDKDKNDFSSTLQVCNTDKTRIQLDLRLADFRPAAGVRLAAAPKVLSPPTVVSSHLVAPAECANVQVSLTGLEQVGVATARATNGGMDIGGIKLVRDHATFAITVDGVPTEKPELHLARYSPKGTFRQGEARLYIRDSDPWPYEVHLRLDIDPYSCKTPPDSTTLTLKPNSTSPVYLRCDDNLFPWFTTGFLKSDTRIGQVAIDVLAPGTGDVIATKRLPVTVILGYFPEWSQPFINSLWSICILVVGALLSVFVTIIIPSWSRRSELKRRLDVARGHINSPPAIFETRQMFPSLEHERARLVLKLECNRLTDILKTIFFLSMNAGTVLDEVQAKTELFEKKVALFRRVDAALLGTADVNAGALAPSVLHRVNLHCATGATLLLRDQLTTGEWAEMAALVDDSERLLAESSAPLDWLEKSIAAIEAAVVQLLCGPDKKLREPVPDPWSTLCGDLLDSIPAMQDTMFFPSQYATRDRRAILFNYVQRYSAWKNIQLPIAEGSETEKECRRFEESCKKRPFELLLARQDLETLESGSSADDLQEQISKAKIQICPQNATVSCFSATRFQVIFSDCPNCNTAPARNQISVRWNFGNGTGNGWETWRYFAPRNESYDISVEFFRRTNVAGRNP